MFIWCRALATAARSSSACTLRLCRIGNMKFWLSPLLSSLVCATQILFDIHMPHRCDDSTFIRASLPTSSAEAVWHGVKLLGVYWQLRSVP